MPALFVLLLGTLSTLLIGLQSSVDRSPLADQVHQLQQQAQGVNQKLLFLRNAQEIAYQQLQSLPDNGIFDIDPSWSQKVLERKLQEYVDAQIKSRWAYLVLSGTLQFHLLLQQKEFCTLQAQIFRVEAQDAAQNQDILKQANTFLLPTGLGTSLLGSAVLSALTIDMSSIGGLLNEKAISDYIEALQKDAQQYQTLADIFKQEANNPLALGPERDAAKVLANSAQKTADALKNQADLVPKKILAIREGPFVAEDMLKFLRGSAKKLIVILGIVSSLLYESTQANETDFSSMETFLKDQANAFDQCSKNLDQNLTQFTQQEITPSEPDLPSQIWSTALNTLQGYLTQLSNTYSADTSLDQLKNDLQFQLLVHQTLDSLLLQLLNQMPEPSTR